MASAALEEARGRIASLLGTRPRQVILTSGATEAAHAAVFGAIRRLAPGAVTVVTPAVEHSCVREASLRAATVRWVGVDAVGRVDVDAVRAAAGGGPALVHCQWANHEVGTLQPVAEVVDACRRRDVMVHVDAASAAGHVPVDFDALGADLMSVSAHKMGGPRGIGALVVRRGLRIEPLLVGGAQERARRAGLEDVASAVAWGAVAAHLAAPGVMEAESSRSRGQLAGLRRAALAAGGLHVFGPQAEEQRLPHLLCLGLDGVEPEGVLVGLDQWGVAAHSGSACASESLEPSPVLAAMGADTDRSLRFSVGWSTTDDDVEKAAVALPRVLERLRSLAASS